MQNAILRLLWTNLLIARTGCT